MILARNMGQLLKLTREKRKRQKNVVSTNYDVIVIFRIDDSNPETEFWKDGLYFLNLLWRQPFNLQKLKTEIKNL